MKNIEILREFLKKRPAIEKVKFCAEAKIHRNTLNNILNGSSNLTAPTWAKILPAMKKYGYEK